MNNLNINSKIKLNNGTSIPVLGFGVYRIPEGEETKSAIRLALDAGYRMIDTAKKYNNEQSVGLAIKESNIPRNDIFITTKLWNQDQGYESTLRAIDESLDKLKFDYVDLYLVHWPTADPEAKETNNKREETWRAMEEIYRLGKAKAIGVSNFTIKHLEEMKQYAKVMPAVNQVEFHPFLYQKDLLEYCKANKIILEAYRPLVNATKWDDETLVAVAKKYNKTVAQILVRWSVERGVVPLPRSSQAEHIRSNIDIFDFEISIEDMATIDSLHQDMRLSPNPSLFE